MAKWLNRLALVWVILIFVLYVPTNGLTSFINRTNAALTLAGLAELRLTHIGIFLRELPVALAGVGIIALAFVLTGVGLQRVFVPNIEDPLVSVLTSLLLGQWVLSLGLFGLALIGMFTPVTVGLLLFGSAVFGTLIHPDAVRQIRTGLKGSLLELIPKEKPWRQLFGLGMILFLLSGITAWAQMSNDGATVYFLVAQMTAIEGQLRIVSEHTFHLTSLHTELQYAAGTLLFNHRAGRLISWLYLLATVLLAFPLGREFGLNKRENVVFAFMVGSGTAILDLAGDGKIDLTGIALGMAALLWLMKALHENSLRLYSLTGLLLGITVIAKPTYIPFMGVLVMAGLIWRFRREWGKLITYGAVIAVAGSVAVTFYMLGKWEVTGEPFAPLFYFEAPPQPANTQLSQTWLSDPQTIRIVRIFFPFIYTFMPTHFSLGTISPLWLAFLPFSISIERFRSFPTVYRWLVVSVVAVFFGWLWLSFAVEEIRYFYIVWVLLFALSARGIVAAHQHKQFREITRILLVATSLLLIVRILIITAGMTDVGRNDVIVKCRTPLNCENNLRLNMLAAEGERVIQVQEFGHYLREDLIACLPTATEYQILTRASSEGVFWETAYDLGFTYLNYDELYSFRSWYFILPEENPVPEGLRVSIVGESSQLQGTLYAITADPDYPPPSYVCSH